jgi:hypothetical protein
MAPQAKNFVKNTGVEDCVKERFGMRNVLGGRRFACQPHIDGLVFEEPVQGIPEATVVQMLQAFAVGCTVGCDSCGDLDRLHTMCAVSSVNFLKRVGFELYDRALCVLGHSYCSCLFTTPLIINPAEDRLSD